MVKLIYGLRILVVIAWTISAVLFFGLSRLRLLVWLSLLPEWCAKIAIVPLSQPGLFVLGCTLFGASSLLLWRRLPIQASAVVAVLIPLLLVLGSGTYGRIDTQGTEPYVFSAAQKSDVRTTREQLVIHMARYQLTDELQALIQAGTSVNAADPLGRSALYWAREPEMVKPLLDAGAKPDGKAVVEAAFWGRLDTLRLLLDATPDKGAALIAEVGDEAVRAAMNARTSGQQDRSQIVQLLKERAAKPAPKNQMP